MNDVGPDFGPPRVLKMKMMMKMMMKIMIMIVGSSFIQKGPMLRSKNGDFEVQKWMDFEVQKWFKNEWIWDPKMVQKWMDLGGAKFPILEGCPWK